MRCDVVCEGECVRTLLGLRGSEGDLLGFEQLAHGSLDEIAESPRPLFDQKVKVDAAIEREQQCSSAH
jgi:hypothetical protein